MTFARNKKRTKNYFAHFAQNTMRETKDLPKGKTFSANELPGCNFISRKMKVFSILLGKSCALVSRRIFDDLNDGKAKPDLRDHELRNRT